MSLPNWLGASSTLSTATSVIVSMCVSDRRTCFLTVSLVTLSNPCWDVMRNDTIKSKFFS